MRATGERVTSTCPWSCWKPDMHEGGEFCDFPRLKWLFPLMVSSPWTKRHVCKSGELARAYCAADSQTEAILWILDVVNCPPADCGKEFFSLWSLVFCLGCAVKRDKSVNQSLIRDVSMSSSGAQLWWKTTGSFPGQLVIWAHCNKILAKKK